MEAGNIEHSCSTSLQPTSQLWGLPHGAQTLSDQFGHLGKLIVSLEQQLEESEMHESTEVGRMLLGQSGDRRARERSPAAQADDIDQIIESMPLEVRMPSGNEMLQLEGPSEVFVQQDTGARGNPSSEERSLSAKKEGLQKDIYDTTMDADEPAASPPGDNGQSRSPGGLHKDIHESIMNVDKAAASSPPEIGQSRLQDGLSEAVVRLQQSAEILLQETPDAARSDAEVIPPPPPSLPPATAEADADAAAPPKAQPYISMALDPGTDESLEELRRRAVAAAKLRKEAASASLPALVIPEPPTSPVPAVSDAPWLVQTDNKKAAEKDLEDAEDSEVAPPDLERASSPKPASPSNAAEGMIVSRWTGNFSPSQEDMELDSSLESPDREGDKEKSPKQKHGSTLKDQAGNWDNKISLEDIIRRASRRKSDISNQSNKRQRTDLPFQGGHPQFTPHLPLPPPLTHIAAPAAHKQRDVRGPNALPQKESDHRSTQHRSSGSKRSPKRGRTPESRDRKYAQKSQKGNDLSRIQRDSSLPRGQRSRLRPPSPFTPRSSRMTRSRTPVRSSSGRKRSPASRTGALRT